MYKILSKLERPVIGHKAEILCLLDKIDATPDFIVVSNDVLKDLFSPILSEVADAENRIKESVLFLKEQPIILRISVVKQGKGSVPNSIHRIIDRMTDILADIRAIYNAYNKKLNDDLCGVIKIAIVIQKYVKNCIYASCFTSDSTKLNLSYIEASENCGFTKQKNSCNCAIFTNYGAIISFDSRSFFSIGRLCGLKSFLSRFRILIKKQFSNENFSISLLFSKDRIYADQVKFLEKYDFPALKNFCFFSSDNYDHVNNAKKEIFTFASTFSNIFSMPNPVVKIEMQRKVVINGDWIKAFLFSSLSPTIKLEEIVRSFYTFINDVYYSMLKALAVSEFDRFFTLFRLRLFFMSCLIYTADNILDFIAAEMIKKEGLSSFYRNFGSLIKCCEIKKKYTINISIPKELIPKDNNPFYIWLIISTKARRMRETTEYLFNKKILSRYKNEKNKKINSQIITIADIPNAEGKALNIKHISIIGNVASEGVAKGFALVIKNPTIPLLDNIKERTILILDHIQYKVYTPKMLKNVVGIAMHRGGLCSHAAILARELGIPCLVGCDNIMYWFKTGDLVKIENGEISLLERYEKGIY